MASPDRRRPRRLSLDANIGAARRAAPHVEYVWTSAAFDWRRCSSVAAVGVAGGRALFEGLSGVFGTDDHAGENLHAEIGDATHPIHQYSALLTRNRPDGMTRKVPGHTERALHIHPLVCLTRPGYHVGSRAW